MLLLGSSVTFVFMGYAISHSEAIHRSIGTDQNQPIWNRGRSVCRYTSRCDSSYPHPRLSLLTDHAESEREAIASASYMRLRRLLPLSYDNFTAPLITKCKWSARTCSTRDGLLESESAESSSLIGLNAFVASHPSLEELSNSDIAGPENQVENSISTQQIEFHSESHLTLHPLGSSLHENYSLVTEKNEDYKYSTVELGPNGLRLFCTARGCRIADVSESEYISGGSGTERRGGDCEAADDENSKSSRDIYYQRMLEANPGNSLLLSNYAKFLYEVQHDTAKAEEYHGRAIFANPEDAEVLSLYAKFTWETHNEAARATVYFARAVKAAPDDCYVLSSYAHFLWNSEEEEEDQNDGPVDLQTVAAVTCIGSVASAA